MLNPYNNSLSMMVTPPTDYKPVDRVDLWLEQSDSFILKVRVIRITDH